jgi:hypothetical protein
VGVGRRAVGVEVGRDVFDGLAIEESLFWPLPLGQAHLRYQELGPSGPTKCPNDHLKAPAVAHDILKAVRANVAVLDRVGGDERHKSLRTKELEKPPKKKADEVAKANRVIESFDDIAKLVSVSPA